MYSTSNILNTNFNISVSEYWNMVPWQVDIYTNLILNEIEKKNQAKKK